MSEKYPIDEVTVSLRGPQPGDEPPAPTDESRVLDLLRSSRTGYVLDRLIHYGTSVAHELGLEPGEFFELMERRLEDGQGTFGLLNIAGDPRDWRKEALEEIADAAIYLACAQLREEHA